VGVCHPFRVPHIPGNSKTQGDYPGLMNVTPLGLTLEDEEKAFEGDTPKKPSPAASNLPTASSDGKEMVKAASPAVYRDRCIAG
jgi:hypothetical protein